VTRSELNRLYQLGSQIRLWTAERMVDETETLISSANAEAPESRQQITESVARSRSLSPWHPVIVQPPMRSQLDGEDLWMNEPRSYATLEALVESYRDASSCGGCLTIDTHSSWSFGRVTGLPNEGRRRSRDRCRRSDAEALDEELVRMQKFILEDQTK
jgi:hypothetical protein